MKARLGLLNCASAVALLAAQAAWAQQAASQGGGSQEEIVVTAERRSENLEETPVAVSALNANMLESRGITTEADIQLAVPGVTVRASLDSNQLNYAIRGQTIDAFSSSQPAVQPYIDEIPVTGLSASTFYDLESLQVLKGPQGTLFGRNTTGGAVLFTTAKPNLDEIEGFVDGKLGDYNLREGQAAINIPIVEGKLAVRLATDLDYRDGFTRNLYDNSIAGDVDRQGYRVSVLFKPIDEVTNDLVVDYSHIGGSPTPSVLYWVTPFGYKNGGVSANTTGTCFYSPCLSSVFGPGSWQKYLAANPGLDPQGISHYLAVQEARGPFVVDLNGHPTINEDNLVISNISTYDLTPNVQLKNIFGFARIRQDQSNIDWDGSPFLLEGTADHDFDQVSRTLTEEFQLNGKIFDDRLQYVGGIYFESDSFWTRLNVDFFGLKPVYSAHTNYDTLYKSESLAGYFQGTYDLSDLTGVEGLGVTAGYRLTRGQSSEDELPGSLFNDNPLAADHAAQELNKISYQFGLQEQLNSNLLLYTVTRRSFREGGFAQSGPVENPDTPANGGTEFFPETAYDVEVGAKFQDRIEDVPIRLNLALYNMWINNVQRTDYQTFPLFGIAGLTANVPEAQVQGFEFDGQVNPTRWLELGANTAYTDARFTKSSYTVFGSTATYGPYPDSPRWTGSASATLKLPLPDPDMGTFTVRGDLYGQTNFFFSSLNNTTEPGTKIAGYGIANFRVGVEGIAGTSLSLAAYVRNAFDHVYYVGGLPTSGVYSTNAAVPGEPRTFYFEAHYDFGGPSNESSEVPVAAPVPPPPAPPPAAAPPPVEIERSFQVFFDFDKSDITEAAAQVIHAAAAAVKSGKVVRLTITGHTDTVGTAAYNKALSERRALAVKQGLVADGVSADEITTNGVGKTGLLVPTGDGVREPQNRRAEIVLL